MINLMFEKWLDEVYEGIPNREKYQDVINYLRVAFEAGFQAKLMYTAEEQLQK